MSTTDSSLKTIPGPLSSGLLLPDPAIPKHYQWSSKVESSAICVIVVDHFEERVKENAAIGFSTNAHFVVPSSLQNGNETWDFSLDFGAKMNDKRLTLTLSNNSTVDLRVKAEYVFTKDDVKDLKASGTFPAIIEAATLKRAGNEGHSWTWAPEISAETLIKESLNKEGVLCLKVKVTVVHDSKKIAPSGAWSKKRSMERDSELSTKRRCIEDLDHLSEEESKEFADFHIFGNDGEAGVPCSRLILAARSSVFRAMFAQSEIEETRTGRITIPDFSTKSLKCFWAFLLTDHPSCFEDPKVSLDLLALGDKYDVQRLKLEAEFKVGRMLNVEIVAEALGLAHNLNCPRLFECCLQFVEDNKDSLVIDRKELAGLPKEVIEKLIGMLMEIKQVVKIVEVLKPPKKKHPKNKQPSQNPPEQPHVPE